MEPVWLRRQVDGFDADGRVVLMGGGEEEALNVGIVHASLDDFVAGFIERDGDAAGAIGLDGANGGIDVVGGGGEALERVGGRLGDVGEAGGEESDGDEGKSADGLAEAAHAGEGGGQGVEEEAPGALGGGFDEARGAALNGADEVRAAIFEEERGEGDLARVEGRGQSALLLHLSGAGGTLVGVGLDAFLFVRGEFAVIVERNQFGNRVAIHVKSPNTARIF